MSYLEITAGQVDADSPLDETLMTQIRDNQVYFKSEKIERDGAISMTGDLKFSANNIRQLNKIYLSDGSIFPDDYLLEGSQNMIASAFLGGVTTSGSSGGNGVINDTNGDFINNGVAVGQFVNIPSVCGEMMFQIDSVTATSIQLKTSSAHVIINGINIPAYATYTVHSSVDNQEWREIASGSDPVYAGTDISIHTSRRLLKLEINNITEADTSNLLISYGDVVTKKICDNLDNNSIVFLRTKNGSNTLTLTDSLSSGGGVFASDYYIYESVDV